MYIYNVTVNIDDDVREEWLTWMQETHMPDVLRTGLFLDARILRVMVDEESGTTYSIQYRIRDLEALKLYEEMYAPGLRKEHSDRYEGKFVAFRTVLEHVKEIAPESDEA